MKYVNVVVTQKIVNSVIARIDKCALVPSLHALAIINDGGWATFWVVNQEHRLCALISDCYACDEYDCGASLSKNYIDKHEVIAE